MKRPFLRSITSRRAPIALAALGGLLAGTVSCHEEFSTEREFS